MQNVKLASSWGVELLAILDEMRKHNQMCDLHLVLKGGIVINVHSCIIAAASPFLKSLLLNTQNPEINMEDFPAVVIKQIIEFIYTGEVTVQGDELIMLHSVAISLHIPALASVAQKLICDNELTATPHTLGSEKQPESISPELSSQDFSHLQSNALPKRKPGRPRKQTSNEKFMAEEQLFSGISDKSQVPEKPVIPPSLQGESVSPQILSDAIFKTRLLGEEVNSEAKVMEPVPTQKHSPIEQIKGREIVEETANMEQPISGDIVCIRETETTPLVNNISVKLERDDSDKGMIADHLIAGDCQSTHQQHEAGIVVMSRPETTVTSKPLLSTVIASLDLNSVLSEGVHHDNSSPNPPRRRTAQGAALAAKVPVHVGPTYTCTKCDRSFTSEDMYNRHCSRHRNNESEVKRFSCQYCKFSTMYKAALDEHVHVHTGEKPYACTECDKAFKHKKSLQIHMWIHAGKKFPCPLCGKEMSTAQYLRRHMSNVHSDYRPYKCSTCSRCFNRIESLKKHMDTHNDVPKYECVVCNQRFLTQIALKNHMTNKHKERRRYCCLKCGNEFINLHKIKSHRCQPPNEGKKRKRSRDAIPMEANDVKPFTAQTAQQADDDHDLSDAIQGESSSSKDVVNPSNQEAVLPDHVYTPKKEEASQVLIVGNSTMEEEIEDTDGETSSEDDDEELLNMDLDEQEDG